MDAIDKRVVNGVTERIDKHQQQQDRKSNLRIGIFSIGVILIVGIGVASVRYTIVNEIRAAVTDQLPEIIEDKIAEVEAGITETVQHGTRLTA